MAKVINQPHSQEAPRRETEGQLLTPEEVAERLRVSRPTVYAWLKMGRLQGLRAGKVWRIRPADLDAFLQPEGKGADTDRKHSREEILQFLEADQREPGSAPSRFVQQLRSWREGDRETQQQEWEQLEAVLAEDRLL
jgi:excisionase family DNA binding protein